MHFLSTTVIFIFLVAFSIWKEEKYLSLTKNMLFILLGVAVLKWYVVKEMKKCAFYLFVYIYIYIYIYIYDIYIYIYINKY